MFLSCGLKDGYLVKGRCLLSSPVVPLYLSPIIWFTNSVINKVAIETGFPCIKTVMGGEGALIREGCLFDIGRSLGNRWAQEKKIF